MKNRFLWTLLCSAALAATVGCSPQLTEQDAEWYEIRTDHKPYNRWWWLGSAVDKENITYLFEEYARAGFGGFEITPIYGVQNNEANDIDYLSPKWMEMYAHTVAEGDRLGLQIDMSNCTGWPFGGPTVSLDDAASRFLVNKYELSAGQRLDRPVRYAEPAPVQRPRPAALPQRKLPKMTEAQRKQLERTMQQQRAAQGPAVRQSDIAVLETVVAVSDKGQRVELTDKVAEDGTLDWTAGEGSWTVYALFSGKTLQKVKRAAPGGEGYVMNHYDKEVLARYLSRFDEAFASSGAPWPNTFFNDSFEVFGSDWDSKMLERFEQMHGYKLQDYLPEFLGEGDDPDKNARIVTDYRETLFDMLLHEFTIPWTEWAHNHGSRIRNQAHGSPGNIIDLYSVVDIPECESFGRTEFDIPGLRKDPDFMRKNDSDATILKFASSGAHVAGKNQTSSETMTWLTEHFRTSLSQIKPELDLMFCSGVNHIYFHGAPYSPREAAWPGWLFYASINMTPNNSFWRDIRPMSDYIARCQSFLTAGTPDNDFLLYMPIYDIWQTTQEQQFLRFDIHSVSKIIPEFKTAVEDIVACGYDLDYISDRLISSLTVRNGELVTEGGTVYKALIVPASNLMPLPTLRKLTQLAKEGARIIFSGQYPADVPGFEKLEERRAEFKNVAAELPAADFSTVQAQKLGKGTVVTGHDYRAMLATCGLGHEAFKTDYDGLYIRRNHDKGKIYFFSMANANTLDGWLPLGSHAESAVLFDPMTGAKGAAKVRQNNGQTEVYMQLKPGESLILKTFEKGVVPAEPWTYYDSDARPIVLDGGWKLDFVESWPAVEGTFEMERPQDWTTLGDPVLTKNMGTGRYTTRFTLPEGVEADEWVLDLGDVRESARVLVNGQQAATLIAVPFRTPVGKYLRQGENTLEVEVTNLPANRIAEYDRQGIVWRIFKDANVANLSYGSSFYNDWAVVPSGLNSEVTLTPVKRVEVE